VAGGDIDVVKAVFAAFATRDVEGVLALMAPDVEFRPMTSEVVGRTEPYRGHDGMRTYFADAARVWEELRLTPQEFREVGDVVLVIGRVSAHSPSRTIVGSTGWLFRLRDGRVVQGRVFRSAADAIRAAAEEG
jgi:ketosteroid isomerase-like protein